MAEIRIEGLEVLETTLGGNSLNVGHLYLVYVDDDGRETVIRGGPSSDKIELEISRSIDISADQRVKMNLLSLSREPVTSEDRGAITIASGENAEILWPQLMAASKKIHDAEIEYDADGLNSNTVIMALLRHVGIRVETLPKAKGVEGLNWEIFKFDGLNAFGGQIIEPFEIKLTVPPYPGFEDEKVEELMEKAGLSTPAQIRPPPRARQNPETGRDQQFPKRKQPSLSDKESFLDLRPRLPAGPIPAEQQKTRITRPEPHPDKTLDNPENIFLAEQESRARLQQALAQIQNPTNDLNMIRQNETGQNKPLSQPEQKPVSDPQRAEFFRRQREIQQKRKHMLDPNQPSLLNLAPPGSELARILEERKQKLAKEKRKSLRANANNTAVA